MQDEVRRLADPMATVAAIIGFQLPSDAAEDSYDMSEALFGADGDSPLREATVHHGSRGWFGIRQGDWVLIDHPTGDNNGGANREPEWFRQQRLAIAHDQDVELFNLREDPGQTTNLAADAPERVISMRRLLDRYKRDGRSVRR